MDRGNSLRPRSTWVRKTLWFWPCITAGALSRYGFQEAGLRPAHGLMPIVPTIPNADRALGIFTAAEVHPHDLLNQMEHALVSFVAVSISSVGGSSQRC